MSMEKVAPKTVVLKWRLFPKLQLDPNQMKDVLDELKVGLQNLTESGASNFSPARFFYIQLMAAKTREASDSVRKIIEEKALEALQNYADDFARAKEQTSAVAQDILEQHPDLSHQLEQLMDAGKFAAIRQLNFRLLTDKASPLAVLNEQLNREKLAGECVDAPLSFRDAMEEQQKRVLKKFDCIPDDAEIENNTAELKAFLNFREFKEKYDTDKLVDQIINERPADMGPLNPHMLLVRSIESMRNLSPHYLSRFITYIDALLRLEDAGKKPAKRRGKKV
ncbi:MAG: DUF2894 domain-containing protein [Oceanicoccus sp.]